jgi:hypothetical protein
MIRLPKIFLALFVAALLVTLTAPAFAGDTKGKIMSVNADRLEFVLNVPDGKNVKFQMDEDAQVLINNQEAQLSDLRAGDQVNVIGREEGGQWLAIEVRCQRK